MDERAKEVLITSETELEELEAAMKASGEGPADGRVGAPRCVEVVIEGWPSVGALPKQVGGCGL